MFRRIKTGSVLNQRLCPVFRAAALAAMQSVADVRMLYAIRKRISKIFFIYNAPIYITLTRLPKHTGDFYV